MDSMSVLREQFSSQVESHIGEYEAIFVADNLVLFSDIELFSRGGRGCYLSDQQFFVCYIYRSGMF